jgi:hypothetical protein
MEEADSEVFAPAPVHTPPLSADQPQARRTDGMTRQRAGRCRRVTRSSGSTDPPTLSACFSESRPLFVLDRLHPEEEMRATIPFPRHSWDPPP